MNWSYKFAFDEIEKMMENYPWLLVDGDLVSAENKAFLGIQKRLMLARGWDWFTKAIRGRVYPKLGLTTMTVWNQERNPDQGDVDPESVAKVQQKFPGISVVSLVGLPHVISGPSVEQDVLSRIGPQAQRWKRELEKIAMKKTADDQETDFNVPYYKDEFQFEIADVDRYATDKYFANLTLQETDKLYSIGFQMYNYQVGITGAVQYWHYEKNEFGQAKKSFNELKRILIKTMSDIEFHRPPMAVITPMVRAAFQPVDLRHKERSGNYFYNWFEELPKEPDWRTTLYGKRYPAPVIQTIESFWREDESGKDIVFEGTSSRSRVLRYKPNYGMSFKHAMANNRLRQLWSDAWKITGGAASGGVLAWLLTLMSPAQLEQQLQSGIAPQQIISQAITEPSSVPSFEPEIGTSIPPEPVFNAGLAKNPPEMVDNGPETARISYENDNLDGLDPIFVSQVQQVLSRLTEKGWQPKVAEGLRSIEQQQQKIDQGYSSLEHSRDSKHVQGLAVDIIDSRYGWAGPASDLDFQFWHDLGQAAKEVGLTWGGDWKTFKDVAHVEVGDKTTGETRAGISRYAYQDADWLKLKYRVRELARSGYTEREVGRTLANEGVSSSLIRRLIAEVFVPYVASAYAENTWNHTYGACETG